MGGPVQDTVPIVTHVEVHQLKNKQHREKEHAETESAFDYLEQPDGHLLAPEDLSAGEHRDSDRDRDEHHLNNGMGIDEIEREKLDVCQQKAENLGIQ